MVNLTELFCKLSNFSRIKYEQNNRISEIVGIASKSIRDLRTIEKEIDRQLAINTDLIDRKIAKNTELLEQAKDTRAQIETVIANQTSSFPWLAKAFSDVSYLSDMKLAKYLGAKSHPALTAAETVKTIAKEKKQLIFELKQAQYKLAYLDGLFPALDEIINDNDDNSDIFIDSDQEADETLLYISKDEYLQMSTQQRNQLALDRYVQKCKQGKHSKCYIGKMYERYIGHLYEVAGYDVEYFGIKKGLEDLGRDLICYKDKNTAEIVQCKNWSSRKEIHENAICQLFGTTIKFRMENNMLANTLFNNNIIPVFITTTKLSSTALEFAKALGVVCKSIPMSFDYPMIKCNINSDKIYHLPFDQQYDTTIISRPGECYVKTVLEAETLGFRRAKRWKSIN